MTTYKDPFDCSRTGRTKRRTSRRDCRCWRSVRFDSSARSVRPNPSNTSIWHPAPGFDRCRRLRSWSRCCRSRPNNRTRCRSFRLFGSLQGIKSVKTLVSTIEVSKKSVFKMKFKKSKMVHRPTKVEHHFLLEVDWHLVERDDLAVHLIDPFLLFQILK